VAQDTILYSLFHIIYHSEECAYLTLTTVIRRQQLHEECTIKLGLDKIKELCTKASFGRGQRYLEEGRVKIREVSPSKITAVVAGTSNYKVEVNLEDKKGVFATCTCPYDWEGYCKHIVATLLAVEEGREEIESMAKTSSERQQGIESLMMRTEPEALRSFLRHEMERLPELRDRFMACFSKDGAGKGLAGRTI
jgi:uncharacterized Zn finger protein